MRWPAVLLLSVFVSMPVAARDVRPGGGSHAIKGHVRKDGVYVPPSRATNPNQSKRDNWSARGNVNPRTGKAGSKDPVTGR